MGYCPHRVCRRRVLSRIDPHLKWRSHRLANSLPIKKEFHACQSVIVICLHPERDISPLHAFCGGNNGNHGALSIAPSRRRISIRRGEISPDLIQRHPPDPNLIGLRRAEPCLGGNVQVGYGSGIVAHDQGSDCVHRNCVWSG